MPQMDARGCTCAPEFLELDVADIACPTHGLIAWIQEESEPNRPPTMNELDPRYWDTHEPTLARLAKTRGFES